MEQIRSCIEAKLEVFTDFHVPGNSKSKHPVIIIWYVDILAKMVNFFVAYFILT